MYGPLNKRTLQVCGTNTCEYFTAALMGVFGAIAVAFLCGIVLGHFVAAAIWLYVVLIYGYVQMGEITGVVLTIFGPLIIIAALAYSITVLTQDVDFYTKKPDDPNKSDSFIVTALKWVKSRTCSRISFRE